MYCVLKGADGYSYLSQEGTKSVEAGGETEKKVSSEEARVPDGPEDTTELVGEGRCNETTQEDTQGQKDMEKGKTKASPCHQK